MLDFTPVRKKEMTMSELTAHLTLNDLRQLSNEMIDTVHSLLEECSDEDVTFVPDDPDAYDSAAATEAELYLPWTLGHVIVHITASAEESAAIAAELARGVPHRGGRSRSEVQWQLVTTLAQCRHRLEESRRICLASLDMWPDEPHLDNYYQRHETSPKISPITYFTFGLSHADSHLGQIAKIVRQAREVDSG
jgi:hypothetical protein